ncbi:MAG: hypothetical protein IKU28_08435 [Erysipelotrichaceae bacterium]|nr:hypothetical protein [Erysipelotrichaceae bacterium]
MEANSKKTNTLPVFIILILAVVCMVFIGINVVKTMANSTGTSTTIKPEVIENKFYTIKNTATAYQKELFDELTLVLSDEENLDKNKAVELVSKAFVADVFTWSNKDGNYDVGGIQYVYGDMHLTFKDMVINTLYANFDLTVAQYGRDYLPEVIAVTADVYPQEGEFVTSFGSHPYYYVYATIDYKEYELIEGSTDKIVDTNDWVKTISLYVVEKDDGRFEIVELYGYPVGE